MKNFLILLVNCIFQYKSTGDGAWNYFCHLYRKALAFEKATTGQIRRSSFTDTWKASPNRTVLCLRRGGEKLKRNPCIIQAKVCLSTCRSAVHGYFSLSLGRLKSLMIPACLFSVRLTPSSALCGLPPVLVGVQSYSDHFIFWDKTSLSVFSDLRGWGSRCWSSKTETSKAGTSLQVPCVAAGALIFLFFFLKKYFKLYLVDISLCPLSNHVPYKIKSALRKWSDFPVKPRCTNKLLKDCPANEGIAEITVFPV